MQPRHRCWKLKDSRKGSFNIHFHQYCCQTSHHNLLLYCYYYHLNCYQNDPYLSSLQIDWHYQCCGKGSFLPSLDITVFVIRVMEKILKFFASKCSTFQWFGCVFSSYQQQMKNKKKTTNKKKKKEFTNVLDVLFSEMYLRIIV